MADPMHHMVTTDFGVVRLSPKIVGYLEGLDPRWLDMVRRPGKFRSKHAAFVRARVAKVEAAAAIMSEIEVAAGGMLVAL